MHLRVTPFLFAAALAAAGCGASAAATTHPVTTAAAPEPSPTRAPIAQGAHGFVRVLGEALGDVPLRASQRAEIEKLAADAEARHAPAKGAGVDLWNTVADQVERGQIDRAALKVKVDALIAEREKTRDLDRAALERLHAILDPDQRVALVNALKAKGAERHGAGPERAPGPVIAWGRDLRLNETQRAKLREAMRTAREGRGKHAAAREHARPGGGPHMLEAFKSNDFKLDAVAPAADVRGRIEGMTAQALTVAEAMVPILSPEQRAFAARKIRERAAAPPAQAEHARPPRPRGHGGRPHR